LGALKLELQRLRAMLLPEEVATGEEKKEITNPEQEIKKELAVSLESFLEDLSG
jgi:hypothetical protein